MTGGRLPGWAPAYDPDFSEPSSPQRSPQPVDRMLTGRASRTNQPKVIKISVLGF